LVAANASLDKLQAKCLVEWEVEKNVDLSTDPTSKPLVQFTLVSNPKKIARNNRTHHSPTDGEARLAQKPNKLFGLYYLSSMSVDTASHVITHIQADCAVVTDHDEKDSRHLMTLVDKTNNTLKATGLLMQNILADGGFCLGENYVQLEARGIQAWIPVIGRGRLGSIKLTVSRSPTMNNRIRIPACRRSPFAAWR
jgi:hypothetical protein